MTDDVIIQKWRHHQSMTSLFIDGVLSDWRRIHSLLTFVKMTLHVNWSNILIVLCWAFSVTCYRLTRWCLSHRHQKNFTKSSSDKKMTSQEVFHIVLSWDDFLSRDRLWNYFWYNEVIFFNLEQKLRFPLDVRYQWSLCHPFFCSFYLLLIYTRDTRSN